MFNKVGKSFKSYRLIVELGNNLYVIKKTSSNKKCIKKVDKTQPNYYKLIHLALTMPVGSVKYERSITVLRRVNYYAMSTPQ